MKHQDLSRSSLQIYVADTGDLDWVPCLLRSVGKLRSMLIAVIILLVERDWVMCLNDWNDLACIAKKNVDIFVTEVSVYYDKYEVASFHSSVLTKIKYKFFSC